MGKQNASRFGLPLTAFGVNNIGGQQLSPFTKKTPVLCPKEQGKNKEDIFNLIP